jgi:hypothetical protein
MVSYSGDAYMLRYRRHNAGAIICVYLTGLLCQACQPSDPATDQTARAPQNAISDSLFGIVTARNDTVCLSAMSEAAVGSATILVMIPSEQRAIPAVPVGKLAACPGEVMSQGAAFFQLNAPDFQPTNLGIAVLAPGASVSSVAHTDINRDGVAENYRACSSVEGIHLTVWAGEPLRGKRLWHYYHYVGYDMEPTCVEADYADQFCITSNSCY